LPGSVATGATLEAAERYMHDKLPFITVYLLGIMSTTIIWKMFLRVSYILLKYDNEYVIFLLLR
jgi:hypothetical protein